MAGTSLSIPFSGAKLRKQRELRGWRQQDLADRIDAQQADISRYETGATVPNVVTFGALVSALGCEPLDLVDGDPQVAA